MTAQQAEAFIDRLRSDDVFAGDLVALSGDPVAVHAFAAAAGFDASPEEIRDAFMEVFSDHLTEEQLAAIAGGMSGGAIATVTVLSVGLAGAAVAGAAAAAA